MEIELDNQVQYKDKGNSETTYDVEFPIIECSIPYSEFFECFLMRNQACLIKNVSTNWESTKKWVQDGTPNFAYLKSKYKNLKVSIQNCTQSNYLEGKCTEWNFQDYLLYWETSIRNNHPQENPLYYLKDWHLKNESTENFYEVPIYFASDWLNEYLVENNLDDFRFVYMGVKGTWTPFHVDVMTTYSWSTNICGQKRWILFPPGAETNFQDSFGNLPQDISELLRDHCDGFEVIQNPGDAIFVPTNWHHQVWNKADTISINHNWINGCNLKAVWIAMEDNLAQVKNEIQDCSDMEDFLDHCQLMLKASFSMNFLEFYKFIMYIAYKRLKLIENDVSVVLPESRVLGKNHAMFDLCAIQNTLELFVLHDDIQQLSLLNNVKTMPIDLLNNIKNTLIHFKQ